ncbi:MAG: hypothetical protein PHV02_06495 [Rhodocyclaceae bacterium]|nr:hypothetical protein [Rhodocyclaceae bacterium]
MSPNFVSRSTPYYATILCRQISTDSRRRKQGNIPEHDLPEIIFLLMLDSGNRYIAIGQVSEPSNVAATTKINHGLAVVHLALYGSEAFGHDGNFLERVTNHRNRPLGNIFVLRCQKVMKPFEVCDSLR